MVSVTFHHEQPMLAATLVLIYGIGKMTVVFALLFSSLTALSSLVRYPFACPFFWANQRRSR